MLTAPGILLIDCPGDLQAAPLDTWLYSVSFTSFYKHVTFGCYEFGFFGVCNYHLLINYYTKHVQDI